MSRTTAVFFADYSKLTVRGPNIVEGEMGVAVFALVNFFKDHG
jgi:hypothetical protein